MPSSHEVNLHEAAADDANAEENGMEMTGGGTSRRSPVASAEIDIVGPADFQSTNRKVVQWHRTRKGKVVLGTLFFAAVIVAVSIPASRYKKLKAGNAQPQASGASPFVFVPQFPEEEVIRNKEAFTAVLLDLYYAKGIDWDIVLDPTSPQGKAVEWVAGSVTYLDFDRARRVQRYALGVLYYGTFQQPNDYWYSDSKPGDPELPAWTSATNWMSNDHECDWEGIDCGRQDDPRDAQQEVTGIFLREHRLSGNLPSELGFLNSLQEIDLSTNFIFVDGDHNINPFTHLENLVSLEMEENFVVTSTSGLPMSLAALTGLQKINLNYNLLKGPLDGYFFSQLSKLTHLEVESNLISGGFPRELLVSTSIVYIYMRENTMKINLPSLLAVDTLPNIFALWLDHNTVTGGIPTSIGKHTDLGSLSITNATLSGRIPDEIGEMENLQRVWLYSNRLSGSIPSTLSNCTKLEVLEIYDNVLTGTMPNEVCQSVSKSDYEFKALSADCEKVSCDNCCTHCYR